MEDFKRKYKKLYKTHQKVLKQAQNSIMDNFENCLDFFTSYIRYMRDYYLLNYPDHLGKNDEMGLRILSLMLAVDEIELYDKCIGHYFIQENGTIRHKPEYDFTSATIAYTKEKMDHWTKFWSLVSTNMIGWFDTKGV